MEMFILDSKFLINRDISLHTDYSDEVYVPTNIEWILTGNGMYITWDEPEESIRNNFDKIYICISEWVNDTTYIGNSKISKYDVNDESLRHDIVEGKVAGMYPESIVMDQIGTYCAVIGYVKSSFINPDNSPKDFNALEWTPDFVVNPSIIDSVTDIQVNSDKSVSWKNNFESGYYVIYLQMLGNDPWDWITTNYNVFKSNFDIGYVNNYDKLVSKMQSGKTYRYKIVAASLNQSETPNSYPAYSESFTV